jgi:molybdopterin-binding protein
MPRSARSLPDLLTPREAATLLGISYPTIKQWILRGSLPTVKTPGGHHRIEASALEPYQTTSPDVPRRRTQRHQISGRNQLVGVITDVTIDGLLARVVLRIGQQSITSIITSDAVREMQLKKGDTAAAVIKSTEVMIARV